MGKALFAYLLAAAGSLGYFGREAFPNLGEIYVLSNSLSSGFCFNTCPWPKVLEQRGYRVYNLSVEFVTTPELATWKLPPAKRGSIVIAWEGSNHLLSDPDGAYPAYAGWCRSLKSQGFRVIAGTLIARNKPGFEPLRTAFNARLRREWRTFADALADPASCPELSRVDWPSPARYFQDWDHPTNVGARVLAECFGKAYRSVSATSSL